MTAELCFTTADELARRIARREVSVTEVVRAHLAQIDRLNPKVNAIVTLTAERALEEARARDAALARGETPGPLFGLPVVHKDPVPSRLLPPVRWRTPPSESICEPYSAVVTWPTGSPSQRTVACSGPR